MKVIYDYFIRHTKQGKGRANNKFLKKLEILLDLLQTGLAHEPHHEDEENCIVQEKVDKIDEIMNQ